MIQKDSHKHTVYRKGQDYYEYENYEIQIDNSLMEYHELIQKVGRGKYSDVYKCINTQTGKYAVAKVLKPVRESKIKREIKILKTLNGAPNIIGLTGITYDVCSKSNCLIHPYVNHIDIRQLPANEITLPRIRNYVFQILQALKSAHKADIMHRDIKPHNVLYDKDTEEVYVADWGLADFYLPMKEYNVRVASRYYKGPQLLLNNTLYGYSLDIWSLGCIFGGLIFFKLILFQGNSNFDQVRAIMQCVGSEEIENYIQKYKLKPDKEVIVILKKNSYPKKPWNSLINQDNQRLATKQALDLLARMLVVDHNERISVDDALKHPFFTTEN